MRRHWTPMLALALVACGTPEPADDHAAHADDPVTLAATVARAVRANPAAADSILTAHRLTRPGLDSLLYRIAADPELARRYQEALQQ